MSASAPFSGWRRACKATAFAVWLIVCMPPIGLVWLEKRLTPSAAMFGLWGQLFAMMPGFLGRWIRSAYYFGTLNRCSWETHIGFGTLFVHRAAEVGPRVSIGAYCVIGHAKIGSDVMIGSHVSIPSGKRQHLDDDGRLADLTRFDEVVVGANCWIGEQAIIMATVGGRSIVSAGAVVCHDVPAGTLVAGNPAAVIRPVRFAATPTGAP